MAIFWVFAKKSLLLAETRFGQMQNHMKIRYFRQYGSLFIRFDLKNNFSTLLFVYNSARKLLFTFCVVCLYSQPFTCIIYIILQQTVWIGLMACNIVRAHSWNDRLNLCGEFQLLLNQFLILKIYLIECEIQANQD